MRKVGRRGGEADNPPLLGDAKAAAATRALSRFGKQLRPAVSPSTLSAAQRWRMRRVSSRSTNIVSGMDGACAHMVGKTASKCHGPAMYVAK